MEKVVVGYVMEEVVVEVGEGAVEVKEDPVVMLGDVGMEEAMEVVVEVAEMVVDADVVAEVAEMVVVAEVVEMAVEGS